MEHTWKGASPTAIWMDELDGGLTDPLASVPNFMSKFKRRPSLQNNHVTFHRGRTTITIHRDIINTFTRQGMTITEATECALMARVCPGCLKLHRIKRKPSLCDDCDARAVAELIDLLERVE